MEYIDIDDDTQNLKIIEDLIKQLADAGVKIIFEISFNFDIPGYPVSVYKISMLEKKYMLKNSRVVSYEKKDLGVFTQKSDVILALNAMIKNNKQMFKKYSLYSGPC